MAVFVSRNESSDRLLDERWKTRGYVTTMVNIAKRKRVPMSHLFRRTKAQVSCWTLLVRSPGRCGRCVPFFKDSAIDNTTLRKGGM